MSQQNCCPTGNKNVCFSGCMLIRQIKKKSLTAVLKYEISNRRFCFPKKNMQGMLKLLPESRKRQKRYCSIIPDILSSGPLVRSMSTTAFKAVQGLFENQKSCISSIFKQP